MNVGEPKCILICGYPKSGTTWLARLIADVLNCPVLGSYEKKNVGLALEGEDRPSSYICYKSHLDYQSLHNSADNIFRYVYIVRDPRDVIVSAAYHFHVLPEHRQFLKKMNRYAFGTLGAWMRKLEKNMTITERQAVMFRALIDGSKYYTGCNVPWSNHVDSFANKEDVFFIKYEDLLSHPKSILSQFLRNMQVDIKDEKIMQSIETQSFDTKKAYFKSNKDRIRDAHLRRGIQGEWRDELAPHIASEIKSLFLNELVKYNYEV